MEPLYVTASLAFVAIGFAVAGLWTVLGFQALQRRMEWRTEARRGAGRVALGAASGIAMGLVIGCSGLLVAADEAGSRVNPPEESLLFLLAIPVGLIVCPGLGLWGLVESWRIAERDPDGLGPAFARPDPKPDDAATDEEIDPLDAPFDPPASEAGGTP